jgi:hypothetical protein
MSQRFTWVPATQAGFNCESEGAELGDGVVEEGYIALVLGDPMGDLFVLEGTHDELVTLLARAMVTVLEFHPEDDYDDEDEPYQNIETVVVADERL